jgi:hypothetical protein
MQNMSCVGLDAHRRTISYCVKVGVGLPDTLAPKILGAEMPSYWIGYILLLLLRLQHATRTQ